MDRDVKIKISTTTDTSGVAKVKQELGSLEVSTSQTTNAFGNLASSIKGLALGTVGIYAVAEAFKTVVSSGLEFNKSTENLKNSLTTLGVATSSNVTTTGVLIGQTQKYAMAADEASIAMQKLQAINADTPHTLNQTVEIYKSMYSSMKMAGVSTDEMVELTKKISIAAGSAGVEFNQLLAGVDGLAKGQVEANSELGRFLDNMGLSNEVLKSSKDIYKTINDALVDIKGGFGSFEEASSNAQNAFSKFAGELTKPLFSSLKDGLNESVGLFDTLTQKITDARTAAMGWSQMATLEQASVKMQALGSELMEYQRTLKENDGALWFGLTDEQVQHTKRKIAEISHEIQLESQRIAKKYEEGVSVGSLMAKSGGVENPLPKGGKTKPDNSAQKAREKEEAELQKLHQRMLSDIQKNNNERIKLEEDFASTVASLNQKNSREKLSGLGAEAFQTFNYYDALMAKYSEVAGAEETLRGLQAEAMDVVIAKQNELDETYNNQEALDSIDEVYDGYLKLIDAQIELAENGMNIDFDFGDGAKELNNISKAMQQLHVGSLKYTKQDMKLQKDFAKNFLEAKGDELKEKELILSFDEDTATLKEAQHNAELAAYSSLAGAMVGAFEQGSAGAIAFTTLQSALGIASSWAAIAEAWALGFPQNIPAVAMVTSAVMPIISQLGGSGGGGGSASASQARVDAGQKRVDAVEAEYTPITDRLDRQIELLERLNLGGTAGVVSIESANRSFERDYKVAIEETFRDFRSTFTKADITSAGLDVDEFIADMQAIEDAMNVKGDVFSSYREGGNFLALGEPVLSKDDNMLKFLAEAAKTEYGKYAFSQKEGEGTFAQQADDADIYYNEILNSIFEITAEYANGMLDVVDELRDASSTMKEAYDSITGTAKYQKQELSDAFADVDALRGKSSYTSYLTGQINAIDKLEKEIDTDLISLLLSEDPERLPEQVEAVRQLGELSGKVFSKGAEDALNYINSIELVSEALASSRENMAEWRQRNETLTDTTKRLAKEAGLENDVKMDSVKSVQNAINVMYKQAWADKLLSDAELEALMSAEALKDELEDAALAITDEKNALLDQIAVLEGTTTSRELELLGLDASNRALQEKIWLLEDEKAITERTTANMGSFIGSLRTLGQSTAEMASNLNVSAATDVQGLADLYSSFVGDNDFTNDELAFLNNNLKLVEEEQAKAITKTMDGLNGTLTDTNKRIGSLENTIGAIDDIVDSLKDASATPETKLEDFYDSLEDASAVFNTSDTSKYEDVIAGLSAQSDILSDTSAFNSSLDMKFAQLVASNKLIEFGLKAQSELSRQESISKEVEAQITATQSMSNTLHNDLLMLISSVDKEREDATIASIVPNTLELMPQSPIPVIVQTPSTTTAGEQTQEEVLLKLVSEVTRLAKIVARFDDGDAMRVRVTT